MLSNLAGEELVLVRPLDQAAVIGFDSRQKLATGLTGDGASVTRAIDGLSSGRGTLIDRALRAAMMELIRRVRAYDTTGKLPTYLIFLDQNFYEPNRGRIWMSFLENPLHAQVRLPGGDDAREKEAAIEKAQQELRAAVAESTLLQQRARTYGDDWLRSRIKVHVNITNPVDWSFWSYRVLPVLGLPDVVMRDHRKISFYDVTELDPGQGEAMYAGVGIGEHYTGPTWDDRSLLARGPAVLRQRR